MRRLNSRGALIWRRVPMADTASNILLLRLQSTGSNTNLWGGYVNDIFETLERAQKGHQEYTVTGDATITWANYTKTNVGAVLSFKLVGTPTAAATLTFPGRQHFLLVWNNCGQSVTIKCSGGTGVTIADGQRAVIVCNGTDYSNWAPTVFPTADITFGGRLRNVTAGTIGTDAVNLTQMQAAISVLSTAQNGLVLNSITDPGSGYFEDKISVAGSLTKTKRNAGAANETTEISFTFDEGNQVLLGGVLSA